MAMGSVGLSSTEGPIPSDLEAIYQGGEFFLDRMKVFGERVAYAKAALAELDLGQATVAAKAAADAQFKAANGIGSQCIGIGGSGQAIIQTALWCE